MVLNFLSWRHVVVEIGLLCCMNLWLFFLIMWPSIISIFLDSNRQCCLCPLLCVHACRCAAVIYLFPEEKPFQSCQSKWRVADFSQAKSHEFCLKEQGILKRAHFSVFFFLPLTLCWKHNIIIVSFFTCRMWKAVMFLGFDYEAIKDITVVLWSSQLWWQLHILSVTNRISQLKNYDFIGTPVGLWIL